MRKIQDISEDEMIAIILHTELHSSRFHQTLEALAIDGARNALTGKVVFGVPSSGLVSMAHELRQGARFPPLILVAKHVDAYLVVMEGHMRLTAYLIAPEYLPSELEVLIGYSEHLTNWGCY